MIKNKKQHRLPREFAEQWLDALRSGDYNQAEGTLYREGEHGYCCLGVACRMLYPLHYLKSKYGDYATNIKVGDGRDELAKNLKKIPSELVEDGEHPNHLTTILIDLNDEENYDFKEIADWIEENVEFYD